MQAKRVSETRILPTVRGSHHIAKPVVSSKLKELWTQLDRQEKTVIAHLSIGSVNGYIRTVRDILQHALETHQAKAEGYFSPSGQFRYLVYLYSVNTELETLRQSLTKPSRAHEVMKRMELIRGLLCDMLL